MSHLDRQQRGVTMASCVISSATPTPHTGSDQPADDTSLHQCAPMTGLDKSRRKCLLVVISRKLGPLLSDGDLGGVSLCVSHVFPREESTGGWERECSVLHVSSLNGDAMDKVTNYVCCQTVSSRYCPSLLAENFSVKTYSENKRM